MTTFHVCPQYIRASLALASSDPTHTGICGVWVEVHAEETLYVATDGKVIGAVRREQRHDAETARVLIPAEACKALLKAAGKSTTVVVTVEGPLGSQKGACLGVTWTERSFFPNWRQVFPKTDWEVGSAKDARGLSSDVAMKAGKFWSTMDENSHAVFVPMANGLGFLALHAVDRGERSKLPHDVRATVFCAPVVGAEALRQSAQLYFPN